VDTKTIQRVARPATLSQRVKIVEKDAGAVTSTKQFVWFPGDAPPCEERNDTTVLLARS